MPLKLIPPRKGKSPNWTIRGSYMRVAVDTSSGTPRRSVAVGVRDDIAARIEKGEYQARSSKAKAGGEQPETFVTAANRYVERRADNRADARTARGGPRRYLSELVKHFAETPIEEIDQAAIDDAAVTLRPHVSGATRNREIYTPVVAVLHDHYGERLPFTVKRPKGAKGKRRTQALTPTDAFGIIKAASSFDPEFATLLMSLLYVGMRIGAALDMRRNDIRPQELAVWIRHQKGQPPAEAMLRPDLCKALERHLATHERERVFRFNYGGHLKHQLVRAKLTYLGIAHEVRRPVGWHEPDHRLRWVTLHTFRHTWATWMRRYGKATTDDLVDSNNWRDRKSAAIYVHAAADGVWDRVNLLPNLPWKIRGKRKA